jgi:hypothetical protein
MNEYLIDQNDELYSRQILAYGKNSMKIIKELKVLVIGLSGVIRVKYLGWL